MIFSMNNCSVLQLGFSSAPLFVQITNEAIGNIRTVAILNKEKHFIKDYSDKIDIPYA